jgi:uncharacterized protein YraI
MALKTKASAVLVAALLLPLAPASALAAAATAAATVNVRSGPDASYGVVAQLQAGQAVDISKCQGRFCYISFGTASGWVAANYLTRDTVARPAIAAAPRVAAASPLPPAYSADPIAPHVSVEVTQSDAGSFDIPVPKADVPGGDLDGGFTIPAPLNGDDFATANSGWHFRGFGPQRRLMAEAGGLDRPGEACFYEGPDFAGAGFCLREGQSLASLGRWSDSIASIRNPDGLRVSLCGEPGFGCEVFEASTPELPDLGGPLSSISIGAPGY